MKEWKYIKTDRSKYTSSILKCVYTKKTHKTNTIKIKIGIIDNMIDLLLFDGALTA